MSENDLRLRHLAIPYQSFPFEIEPHAPPGVSTDQLELLKDPTLTADLTKTVQMSRPENGQLIEMYLFMQMIAPTDKALNVRIGIDSLLPDHLEIAGTTDPYTAAATETLTIEAKLMRRIPGRGEGTFVSDYFPLLVNFDSLPDPANDYELVKFSIHGSAQMALV